MFLNRVFIKLIDIKIIFYSELKKYSSALRRLQGSSLFRYSYLLATHTYTIIETTPIIILSVFCKRSEAVVFPRTIVKCSWEDTISQIVSKLDKIPEEAVVEIILISKSEKIVDPVHIVSLDTLLLLFVNSLAASMSIL